MFTLYINGKIYRSNKELRHVTVSILNQESWTVQRPDNNMRRFIEWIENRSWSRQIGWTRSYNQLSAYTVAVTSNSQRKMPEIQWLELTIGSWMWIDYCSIYLLLKDGESWNAVRWSDNHNCASGRCYITPR